MIGSNPIPQTDLLRVHVANPAVATNFTYTWPDGYQYLLLAVVFVLTPDANPANRNAALRFGWDGVLFDYKYILNIVASTARVLYWYTGASFAETLAIDGHQMRLPYPLLFNPADTLACQINNMQVGDQVSDIDLRVMRRPLTQ